MPRARCRACGITAGDQVENFEGALAVDDALGRKRAKRHSA